MFKSVGPNEGPIVVTARIDEATADQLAALSIVRTFINRRFDATSGAIEELDSGSIQLIGPERHDRGFLKEFIRLEQLQLGD